MIACLKTLDIAMIGGFALLIVGCVCITVATILVNKYNT